MRLCRSGLLIRLLTIASVASVSAIASIAVIAAIGGGARVHAQAPASQGAPAASSAQPAAAPAPGDALGRDTPRGTVLGFLNAARRDEFELARQYLDTRLSAKAAETLARQLFVVLDARLPARLPEISANPEGSRANPLTPDQEQVGAVQHGTGKLPIILDRVSRAGGKHVWLFSTGTLAAVPELYDEVTTTQRTTAFPRVLTGTRVGGVLLSDWAALLLGIPILYLLIGLANRLLTPVARPLWRRVFPAVEPSGRSLLPAPVRLLLLALMSQWLISSLPLSLVVRQLWANAASLIAIVALVWMLMVLNGEIETLLRRRVPAANFAAAASLLRLARRACDVLIIFAGLIAMLRHFRIDPTPALAGLGVGGIAIALAAQKTLENVVAGASLIFDQAVRVGDFLKMGEIVGTVDYIGLRSTRIRTLDRTIVSVPNSQIASASLETISARDQFWFHPTIGLRYETTPDQLRSIAGGITRMLHDQTNVMSETVRARFIRMGAFSLDIEVVAYLHARDWGHFLELQERLLFGITDIVSRAGAEIAFPSQTMYVNSWAPASPAPLKGAHPTQGGCEVDGPVPGAAATPTVAAASAAAAVGQTRSLHPTPDAD